MNNIDFLLNSVLPLSAISIMVFLIILFLIRKVKISRGGEIKVVFLKPIGDNYEKIGEKKIGKDEEIVTYKDKTFPLTSKCSIFINSGTPYIFIDFEKNKILKFNEKSIGINPQFLDMLLTTSKKGIIGQLMYALNLDMTTKTEWSKMLKPIVIFIIGAIIGYLIGSPQQIGG